MTEDRKISPDLRIRVPTEAEINGWKPPVIYDVTYDEHRIATQDDIARMEFSLRILGAFYQTTKRAIEEVEAHRKSAPAAKLDNPGDIP